MAYNLVTIPEIDFGAGIDSQSAASALAPGFVEDAINADAHATGQIGKRRGYQTYAGNIPLRVQRVVSEGTDLTFYFDSTVNTSMTRSVPLVVYGRAPDSTGGDIGVTDSVHYYAVSDTDIRYPFGTGSHTETITENQHGIASQDIWAGFALSQSEGDNSNLIVGADSVVIDKVTHDLSVTATNNTGSPLSTFIYFADKSAVAGSVYVNTVTVPAGGPHNILLNQATHQLDTTQVLLRIYLDDGSDLTEIQPDSFVINKSTGDISIGLTNNTGSPFDVRFMLSVCPTANFHSDAVASGATRTVQIDLSGFQGSATPFVFLGCYLISGVTATEVKPNYVSVDPSGQVLELQFVDNGSGGGTFEIYWEFVPVVSNFVTVQQGSSATYEDDSPQLTIWGFDHEDLYFSVPSDSRAGWTTHIDSYRSLDESGLVAGLGGNLFSAERGADGSTAADYLYGAAYPNLQGLVSLNTAIGPAFWDTGETPLRTRGWITADNSVGVNVFEISSVTYDSGLGWVRFDLNMPNLTVIGTLSNIISTTFPNDLLTVESTSYAIHDGSWKIRQVTVAANSMSVWVENDSVTSSDWDILGAGGNAGIFSDYLDLSTDSNFIAGDVVRADIFADTTTMTVVASVGPRVTFRDLYEELYLPTSMKLVGQRTSSIVPLRESMDNLVRGDMLSYGDLARQLRVLYTNTLPDTDVTISAGDGIEATVTLLGGATISGLWIGQKVLFSQGQYYQGTYEITSLVSGTTFTISSTLTDADSAVMVGQTVEVDEDLDWQDTTTDVNFFEVDRRWIPIEAPSDSFDLTASTYIAYLQAEDYSYQSIVRSSMVKDSLMLTNYGDPVLKYDGTNLYRAGIPRFQPHLFMSVDYDNPTITVQSPSIVTVAHSSSRIELSVEADLDVLRAGDVVLYTAGLNTERLTVQSTETVGSTAYVYTTTTPSIASAAGTLQRLARFRYYFRLNAVDTNNLIVASAVVGSEDMVAELADNASVRLKLTGFPAWDNYDFDRLEVQVYRTRENTLAPFYRVTTLPLSFDNNAGYMTYTDTSNDADLLDLDEVSTALAGAELGTTWSEPLRAKYVTASGNSLILGNIQDWPTLDIQLLKVGTAITDADLVGQRFLFRRDDTDTGTATNMVDRAAYRFLDSSSSHIISGSGTINTTSFTLAVGGSLTGLVAGSWVYLHHNNSNVSRDLRWSGWYQVTGVAGSDVTFAWNGTDTSAWDGSKDVNGAIFSSAAPADVPVFLGNDYNYGMLNGNEFGSVEFRAMRRLGDAINATMRNTNIALTGQETFTPWLIAGAGNDFGAGQLVVRQPKVEATSIEVVLPTFTAPCQYFVNSIKRTTGASASQLTRLFPSRILISYPNFSEIFDAPTALKDLDSASAVDVNPDDGQEITAIIPFFGESAFGAALNSGVVVVFKTNSIYLVDLAAKAAGQNPVQRIESQGKGCTAPYSVAVTRNGIMFANENGIYRLTRQLTVDFVGRKYSGVFRDNLNKDYLSLVTGHNNPVNNTYKMSYVLKDGESVSNSQVAVYNHTREYEMGLGESAAAGSWVTYDNHPATGWANLPAESFFASTKGRVFTIRQTDEDTDFRDDSEPVSMTIVTRGNDFGEAGIRKYVRALVTHWIGEDSTGTTLQIATDLVDNYEATDPITIHANAEATGVGDTGRLKVDTILSSIDNAKAVYFQVKIQNSTIDENVILTRLDWRVAGLKDKGILQAAQTSNR